MFPNKSNYIRNNEQQDVTAQSHEHYSPEQYEQDEYFLDRNSQNHGHYHEPDLEAAQFLFPPSNRPEGGGRPPTFPPGEGGDVFRPGVDNRPPFSGRPGGYPENEIPPGRPPRPGEMFPPQPGGFFPPEPGGAFPPQPGNRKPTQAPPSQIPEKRASLRAVDPGGIRPCLYSYTYVWLTNGRSFWFYPTFVGRKSVSGYRWSRYGWSFIGFDLDLIESFVC